ncbi:MAG: hypothetical protein U5L08_14780 [Xanthomonadales bacterium]|nr:hypothetical protein [Xanthomonadales bacterium]
MFGTGRKCGRRHVGRLAALDSRLVGPTRSEPIRAIAEHFETDNQRKALLVMATGPGKTRTVDRAGRSVDARPTGSSGCYSWPTGTALVDQAVERVQGAPAETSTWREPA